MNAPRYAIYYAPSPESPLWRFGSSVLGYDAATGEAAPALAPAGVSPEAWREMTAAPRRYGFHATLKAPFRLADGATEDDLVAAGRAFGRGRKPFALPDLGVTAMGAFVALAPLRRSANLHELADACVEAFERFRKPPGAAERARRLAAPLTARQHGSLERWGYPYVFEDFRFHMTLTGGLPIGQVQPTRDALAALYDDHVATAGTIVDAVALYVQDTPEIGFKIVDRFAFTAG